MDRSKRRRSGVEDIDTEVIDDLPVTAGIGIMRHRLEHDTRRPITHRTVDDVAVPGHPPDVSGAEIHIAAVIVEDIFMRERCEEQVTGSRMHEPLRLAGRSGCVEDE